MPALSGVPFSIDTANPNGSSRSSRSATSPAVAVLSAGSVGSVASQPVTRSTRTAGSSMQRTLTQSPPAPSSAQPSTS